MYGFYGSVNMNFDWIRVYFCGRVISRLQFNIELNQQKMYETILSIDLWTTKNHSNRTIFINKKANV